MTENELKIQDYNSQFPTDIAIVEQMFGGNWRKLAYIGPKRENEVIDYKLLHGGGSIRVRYLNNA